MMIQAVLMMVMCLLGFRNSIGHNFLFNVHHKYGGRDSSNPSDLRAHDLRRHGRMLGAVDLQIGGTRSPTGVGLYYIKLMIGTPPKAYHVHFDTGSDTLWLNCAGCDSCPKKTSLGIDLVQYDIKASSSASWVSCYQDFCYTSTDDCDTRKRCEFDITYAEGSKTEGSFIRDYVHIDQVTGNLQTASVNGTLVFGCSSKVSGLLSTAGESADGIIGFGQAKPSLVSQLTEQGKVKNIFSHCFNGHGGGILALGQVVQPKVNSTPLVPYQAHYTVILKSIEVGGDVLDIPSYSFRTALGISTIIDSGTTFAYFNHRVYGAILDKLLLGKHYRLKIRSIDGFECFDYHGNVDDGFPVITLNFQESKFTIYPHDYLLSFQHGVQCFGLKVSNDYTLLGDIVLSNKLFVFDLERQTVGWTEHNCSSSIQVKDESTGNVYTVGAHIAPSSSDSRSETINMFILFLLILHFCM